MQLRQDIAKKELVKLESSLKGKIIEKNGLFSFQIAKSLGKGNVKYLNFKPGFLSAEFQLNLYNDIEIPLPINNADSVYLMYCFTGSCYYKDSSESNYVKIKELQTAIVKNRGIDESMLLIKADQKVTLNIICLKNTSESKENDNNTSTMPRQLRDLFAPFKTENSLVHIGNMNFEIGELVKKLGNTKYDNKIPQLLHFEGICTLILAGHIQQIKQDNQNILNTTSLIKREIKVVMEIADAINQSPEKQYSLKKLCAKSGLSAAKLQEGFKFLYKRTVSDYIRNTRLERAEQLLRQTDMNISEVVYSIGLTSRSYFCKIFKAKYNCSPKDYKRKSSLQLESLQAV